jgi:transglutaminase-like putative cysteine protease
MVALAAGHWVSYRRRRAGIVWISMAIGLFIVVLGIAMRLELVAAVRGDRVPMAFFLLATGAASSFDLRTRAGLYTQLIFSAIVMFFAGELAFNNGFSLLLGGYGMIVVSFFAIGFWEDEASKARKVKFAGPVAPVALTSVLSLILIATSVAAFMLLPWNSAQTPPSARTTFVPFSGEGAPPGMSPQQARQILESQGTFGPQAQTTVGPDGLVQIDTSKSRDGGNGANSEGFFSGTSSDELAALARIGDPFETSLGDAEDLVMHVRSPIASYWRASAYDTYSPGGVTGIFEGMDDSARWYATYDDDSAYASFYQSRNNTPEGERYLQTFFIGSDVGGEILTGYDPISVLVPRDGALQPVVEEGTTYQVVSRRPETSPNALRNDRAQWQGPEYVALPEAFGDIAKLTRGLVAEALTDFDRAASIASYLSQLELDETAENQLVSVASLDDFVFGRTPGTSMDFATAMTLMARAAGLPTRLADGYLPGSYNPFSGANTVTQAEAHTWAEVAFQKAGWVPFDAAPRVGGTEAANSAGTGSNPLVKMLQNRLGDRIAGEVGGGIGGGLSGLWKLLTNGFLGMAIMLIWFAIGVVGWYLWRRWKKTGDGVSSYLRYSAISG